MTTERGRMRIRIHDILEAQQCRERKCDDVYIKVPFFSASACTAVGQTRKSSAYAPRREPVLEEKCLSRPGTGGSA